jgi:hypothetical protein
MNVRNDVGDLPKGARRSAPRSTAAGAGGCFRDEQIWLVRSVSAARYDFDQVPNIVEIEIVEHWDPSTCFGTSEVRVAVN